MMAELRVLTEKGVEKFREYIYRVRSEPLESPPVSDLNHSPWSTEFVPHVDVNSLSFTTRMEFGKYLVQLFEINKVERKDIINNPGLWSWLALLWFDTLCPIESGERKVNETARYVCSTDYTDYYRHLVAASWDIYYLHEDNCRLMLSTPLGVQSDYIEQLASRQNIITNRALIEVFDGLYWDKKAGYPKRSAQSKSRAGNFRRLLKFAQQIEMTYDLYAMSANEILSLLPAEYDSWKL